MPQLTPIHSHPYTRIAHTTRTPVIGEPFPIFNPSKRGNFMGHYLYNFDSGLGNFNPSLNTRTLQMVKLSRRAETVVEFEPLADSQVFKVYLHE